MSKTWKLLNSKLFRSGKQKSVFEIELNGSMVSDLNILVNNFTNIGSNLAKKNTSQQFESHDIFKR